jgi:transposase
LINFGLPCPVSDLFGLAGRELLQGLALPERWRQTLDVSLELIDGLDLELAEVAKQLRATRADHRCVPLLLTAIGDIQRFAQAKNLTGYSGRCPRVDQSGERDRRGALSQHGPRYLRWALLAAPMQALRQPAYSERYQRTKRRLAKQRGAKVAQIDVARRLSRAIWHMLTNSEPFNAQAPGGAASRLTA